MKIKKTIVKWGVFSLLIVLFKSCKNDEEIRPMVRNIEELVFASGSIEWDDAYNLTAQTDGILKEVNFEVGSTFVAGQQIARIDNPSNHINEEAAARQFSIANENASKEAPALEQLAQSIEFAEEKLKQDQKQAARFTKLLAANGVSKLEYENALLAEQNSHLNVQSLKKQWQQAKLQSNQNLISADAQFKNAKIQNNYTRITVPENGVVIKKMKSNGDYVRKGEVIAVMANRQAVRAVLNVDEKSISKVHIGQKVFIRLNTENQRMYKAYITEILSAFDEQTQSFICKAAFEKPLHHAFFGTQLEANILVGKKNHALVIPRTYLGFGNKVQLKGVSSTRTVQTGIISSEYAEIKKGLTTSSILVPLKP